MNAVEPSGPEPMEPQDQAALQGPLGEADLEDVTGGSIVPLPPLPPFPPLPG